MSYFEKTDNQIFVFVLWCELLVTLLIWAGAVHPTALLGSIPAGVAGIAYRSLIPVALEGMKRMQRRPYGPAMLGDRPRDV